MGGRVRGGLNNLTAPVIGIVVMNGTMPAQLSCPWWQRLLIGRHPKRTLVRLTVLVVLSFVVFKWILLPVRIVGISMEPTYHNGKINFINTLSYRWGVPQRGDVVGVRLAGNQVNVMLLKRIIALPGERVAIREGLIYVNGVRLDEPYVRRPRYPSDEPETLLEPGKYYILGDNREMPLESHTHGAYEAWRLVGKVLF